MRLGVGLVFHVLIIIIIYQVLVFIKHFLRAPPRILAVVGLGLVGLGLIGLGLVGLVVHVLLFI